MAKLQDTLDKMFGQLNIAQTQLPEYFENGIESLKTSASISGGMYEVLPDLHES